MRFHHTSLERTAPALQIGCLRDLTSVMIVREDIAPCVRIACQCADCLLSLRGRS